MTGTIQLAAIYSQCPKCVVMLNFDGCNIDKMNHPVLMGQCIRFSQETEFIFVDPSKFKDLLPGITT